MCIFIWYVLLAYLSNLHLPPTQIFLQYLYLLPTNVPQIPKPNITEGLSMSWPAQQTDMDKLKALFEDLKAKM